jgi:hypothetical protein
MGYFRRFKLSDYTAEQCRKEMLKRETKIVKDTPLQQDMPAILEEWACFRELLARHENQNKSQLDQ